MDLERTLDQLAPKLLRFCRSLGGDPAVAEEVSQDALIALVQRWRRHGEPQSPTAFVFAIARRRMRRRQLRQRWLAPLDSLLGMPSPHPDPESSHSQKQALQATLDALKELSPNLREALLLVAVAELDGATAAASLGISPSAFKMRLHRARKQLRSRLCAADLVFLENPDAS